MRLAAEPERVFMTEELANELAISRNHLVKIVRVLGSAGFVTARRGKKGDSTLHSHPRTLALATSSGGWR
jgi:Rrf2 family nitric oxide-sensitive transcriptional repressor